MSWEARVRYLPLYIHSFQLDPPKKKTEATRFLQQHSAYQTISNIPDRLRWCRYHKGLRQVDVARDLSISLSAYKALETGQIRHISTETAQKLALYYNVPVTDFLDGYDRFLYEGQAGQIRGYRERLGMGRKAFAKHTGIPLSSLRAWETGKKTVSRQSWEQYFRDKI